MNVKLVQELLLYRFRYYIAYTVLFVVSFLALFFQLGTLVPGLATIEASSILASHQIGDILSNPVNGLYSFLQWVSVGLFGGTGLGARFPSALVAIFGLGCLYYILHTWHKDRIAIIGTILMATSSWFLHGARLGTDGIMIPTTLLFLLAILTWFRHASKKSLPVMALAIAGISLSIYVPYMLILLLIGVASYHTQIRSLLTQTAHGERTILIAILVAITGPLLFAIIRDVHVAAQLIGINSWSDFPAITEIPGNIFDAFGYVFWSARENPAVHLDTIAMLDIFTATMTALGLYHYERHMNQLRTRLLIGGFFASLLLVSIGGNQTHYTIFLPFVYIFAATGIITLLTQWYNIFPKNPFARTVAIVPITIVLFIAMGYHYNRYFVAWARTAETKETFAVAPTLLRSDLADNQTSGKVVILTPESSAQQVKASLLGLGPAQTRIVTSNPDDAESYDMLYIAVETDIARPSSVEEQSPDRFVFSSEQVNFIKYEVFEKNNSSDSSSDDTIETTN